MASPGKKAWMTPPGTPQAIVVTDGDTLKLPAATSSAPPKKPLRRVASQPEYRYSSPCSAWRITPTQELPEELLRCGEPEFEEEGELLKELRSIFDWMAQEKGCMKIPSRKFKERVPELHRRMPQIASSFRRMDVNGDCWLEWWEFATFCLKDRRLMHLMKRTTIVSVYAKERDGSISYKDMLDPHRQCEVGTIPPILPWEVSHIVEWRIENLLIGELTGCPVTHGPVVVRPGISLASPPLRAAGVCGILRFWPAGYWTEAQRRLKVQVSAPHFRSDEQIKGPYPMPAPDAWCSMSLNVPAGTHLVFRFFTGGKDNRIYSDRRNCFWHEGNFPGMLWSPDNLDRPVLKEGDTFTIGVEIFRNLGMTDATPPKKHKQQGVKDRTPFIRDTSEVANAFVDPAEKLRTKSMSLPALPTSSTWRNLDRLLQKHRRDMNPMSRTQ